MKKLLLIPLIVFFFSGCGPTVTQSEFYKHNSHYKNWDHTLYSWFGFKQPTSETGKMSDDQRWWGLPVEHKGR